MPADTETAEQAPALHARRLGADLRARRKDLGINMTAAAEAAGVSRVTWHRLEKGELRVAWGSLLAAAAVLGMELRLGEKADAGEDEAPRLLPDEALPLRIRLVDFPGLRRLAWQVGEGVETLTVREAFGLYMRNGRHLDMAALPASEVELLRKLREVFGEPSHGV